MDYEPTFTRRYEYRRLAKTSDGAVNPVKGFLLVLLFVGLTLLPAILKLN